MKAGESGKDAQKKLVAIGTGAVAMALSLAYLGGLFFLPSSEVSFSCGAIPRRSAFGQTPKRVCKRVCNPDQAKAHTAEALT